MCYDFGKELRRTCSYEPHSKVAREYLLSMVEEFKKLFPNLSLDHPSIANMKIEVGSRKYNLEAFVVRSARDGFRKKTPQ